MDGRTHARMDGRTTDNRPCHKLAGLWPVELIMTKILQNVKFLHVDNDTNAKATSIPWVFSKTASLKIIIITSAVTFEQYSGKRDLTLYHTIPTFNNPDKEAF